MRMTIDVWNELPFLVRNKLQIMGQEFNTTESGKANQHIELALLGTRVGAYVEALQDAGLIEDDTEATLLRKYVLSIGKEGQA